MRFKANPLSLRSGLLRTASTLFVILLVCGAMVGATSAAASKQSVPAVPQNATKAEMDSFIAQLNDEQVRRILISELKKQADHEASLAKVGDDEKKLAGSVSLLESHATSLREGVITALLGAKELPQGLAAAWQKLKGDLSLGDMMLVFVLIAAIYLIAILPEAYVRKKLSTWDQRLSNGQPTGAVSLLSQTVQHTLIELIPVLAYAATVVVLFMILGAERGPLRAITAHLFIPVMTLKLSSWLVESLISVKRPRLRFIKMSDKAAAFTKYWFTLILSVSAFVLFATLLLERLGISDGSFIFLYSILGWVEMALIMVMVARIKNLFDLGPEEEDASAVKAKVSQYWHYGAFLYVAVVFLLWQFYLLSSGQDMVLATMASLGAIVIYLTVDRIISTLFASTVSLREREGNRKMLVPGAVDALLDGESKDEEEDEADDDKAPKDGAPSPGEEEPKEKIPGIPLDFKIPPQAHPTTLLPVVQKSLRVVMVVALGFWLLELWGFTIPLGEKVISTFGSILLTIFLAFVAWEFARASIDARIKPEAEDGHGGEGEGGVGGDRLQTLLPLLRKTLVVVITLVSVLIILSSLGVDIAPLLAGAGVFGLAIGFGAQTLVKDIVSGIFFMIDDAFRVGDYVTSGSNMGTVEKISIRSLKLRHHLGMVHVIPYSQLRTVTNRSRDWVITKLKFRVPYDTDIKQVKKIVKKINKKLQASEEHGHKFLAPLKSQGVKKFEDSAMLMRVKFMTRPGDQFMLKREIWKEMQKAFEKAGIQFAHRKVTVELPDEYMKAITHQQLDEGDIPERPDPVDPAVVGGAAAQLLLQEEAEAQAAQKKDK